ncbi:MAG: alanine--tRNA ligase [Chitinophagales bacterium]|nr:alanine--tRNA ligase [Chitinophagales bacterium]
MLTANEIRQQFLDFFREKGHTIVPSSPIVVKNDPTLLFINAGMNQFKDYFLGNKPAPNPRVADTQKCLRVSGKHNDLEEVGVDTYHHTMFEMLGNWSFGDYFKEEAIAWSWELLTEVYKIDKDRLYVTVFEGDAGDNLPKDEDAYNFWKKWIAEDRILMGNKKDNFWEMGDTGPCGPCSEIHVDCRTDEERKQVDGKTLVNADHPQVIEIWNNVFMEFNRLKDGSLQPLPAKHVDTGMGLERLVRVLQDNHSNYDTDLFTGTIAEVEKITGKKYHNTDSKEDIAFRVIADHIRAIAFTIADGQLPSNTGAGYVIRRILRRAVRYYYSYLDYKQPLLNHLMAGLASQFEGVFPELHQQLDLVTKVVKEEEDAFLRTLDKGLKKVDEITTSDNKEKVIPGEVAFELNDTFGFPIDLTELIAKEKGWTVDIKGFEAALQQQKDRSRAATALDTQDWVVVNEGTHVNFVGYDSLEAKAQVLRYRKVTAKGKESYQLVLDTTPFYAESGGQVGDRGELQIGSEKIYITDTKKENDLIIHFAQKIPASLEGEVLAKVNVSTRRSTEIHHSATHLLHAALRSVLGTHVAQKGSLVNEEHLRFDFSHFAKVTDEEIAQIEAMVNEKIRENVPVVIREMPKDEAVKLGAMALFGEKYGDTVRVVTIDPTYSIELCGGTHVGATGQLGMFKIKHESAVAAGVRRIEAVSGKATEEYINEGLALLHNLKEVLKNSKDPLKAVEKLQEEKAQLEKHTEMLEARQLVAVRNEVLQKDEVVGDVNFVADIVEVPSPDALKKLCFDIKHHVNDHVVVLCSNIGGKAFVAIGVDDTVAAAKGLDANAMIKQQVAPLIKGGGGGQKTLATAGGQNTAALKDVISAVKALLS